MSSNSKSIENVDSKGKLRRLLALGHGITKLPELISRRRFGIQVPADFDTVQVANTRSPCCTHSLAPVKTSFSMAASAIAKRSLKSLKMDTRRCYLCGYLVCIDCWSAEYIDTTVGRVAAIVVCTQCRVCVNSCDYSEVYAPGEELNRGPVKVVENQDDESPALLLTEFLTETLMNLPADSADRAAVLSVVRTLLQQSKPPNKKDDDDQQNDIVEELGEYLSDKRQMPELETCVLANAEQRNYVLDQPNEPAIVPPMIIPPHEEARLQLVNDEGLMLLANQVAPIDPSLDSSKSVCDVSDLDVLCQLAVRETGCSHAFVTIMGSEHQHILSSSNQSFGGATMPREHTFCQHTIMTSKPLMVTHPEADVRFHELDAIKALNNRCYVGFPLMVDGVETEMPVGHYAA